jgi:FKBP-type peptidyl-prolyl cis-trans isomerase FkpA
LQEALVNRFSAAAAVLALVALAGCSGEDTPTGPTEVTIQELTVGTGAGPAAAGNTVTTHYTGMFTSGQVFDSSVGREPITFTLGAGQLIPGFEQGVVGMRVGGRRRVTVPPSLAYGSQGRPPQIPPNSTLIFDIELVAIR